MCSQPPTQTVTSDEGIQSTARKRGFMQLLFQRQEREPQNRMALQRGMGSYLRSQKRESDHSVL